MRQHPLSAPEGGSFGYGDLVRLTVWSLYRPWAWGELAHTLQQLYAATRPSTVRAAVTAATRTREFSAQRSAAATPPYNNQGDALLAIVCSESRNPEQPDAYRRVAGAADQRAPYVGAYWAYINLPCAQWRASAQDRFTGPWATSTSNPVLLLNPRYDPATPHRNAVTMNRLLRGSRLVTVNGWGHTAALGTRSACADGTIERYLIELRLPRAGAACPTGVVPFAEAPRGERDFTLDSVLPIPSD